MMFMFSGVFAAVFLGGYNLPLTALAGTSAALAPLWFVGKCVVGVTMFIWLRATLPRLRYDQLMNLGWRTLLPVAVANFLVVALWIVSTAVYGAAGGWIAVGAAAIVMGIGYTLLRRMGAADSPTSETRALSMSDGLGVEYREGVAGK